MASKPISLPLASLFLRVINASTLSLVMLVLSLWRTCSLKLSNTSVLTGTSVDPSTGDQVIPGLSVSVDMNVILVAAIALSDASSTVAPIAT